MNKLLCALGALLCLVGAPAFAADRPLTLLISIDGFRADYLDRGVTPALSALAAGGVRAKAGMRPSFPSLTYPNHYTLVTGLRPDHHGLVDNVMVDATRPGQTFRMGAKGIAWDRFWWDGGTPIWVTAEQAGLRTATMFWPGSDLDVQGVRPHDWLMFNQAVLAPARVDQVLAWVDRPPAERPSFITLYFDDVDTAGHYFGPDSREVEQAAGRVDAQIGRLVAGLKDRGLAANIVVVADHGMAPVSKDRIAYIDDVAPAESLNIITMGSSMELFPAAGQEAEVRRAVIGRHPHFTCWPKARLPVHLHFGTHPRIPPIVCVAQTGWMLETHAGQAKHPMVYKGAHGFDPYDPTMRALFVAAGPDFKPGVVLPVFDNVDVYPLLARLVGVTPLKGDGDLAPLQAALTH
ncbi:ectonucleotide pyrophosphatase/phosphodiesterase [Phenylobacterium aquaticum]|uniref:alkaline phosphatase family protein n=1 Tax=Phenylobacterium aquaticum TaxID=1763816 RepID=UPI0026F338A2|nr:ectonucleotide pyrophosphatase/phosphodiesterase [Phenylobacterium aquaticum]